IIGPRVFASASGLSITEWYMTMATPLGANFDAQRIARLDTKHFFNHVFAILFENCRFNNPVGWGDPRSLKGFYRSKNSRAMSELPRKNG
ncbi:MAG TPA: hypothetical protein VKG87_08490, partial [Terriglobales bacterium]|nr:hypothetical protein [Terriglobales bacterium]